MRDWKRVNSPGRVRREEGVEPKACILPESATFLHPRVPRDGGCRVEYFQTTVVTLQSAGKIFKKAVKSGCMLYNIWSQS